MLNPESEEQSWPPASAGYVHLPVTVPPALSRGLKIGIVAALLGMVFTLWRIVRLTSGRYPLFRSLPDMPTHTLFMPLLGSFWMVLLCLPMLAVLILASVGLAFGIREWHVSRHAGQYEGFWIVALGLALNLLPFVLFAGFFIKRGWISIAVE